MPCWKLGAQKTWSGMKTIKKEEKTFDAVKMMREIRRRISEETSNMTLEELKKHIEIQMKKSGGKPVGNP